jgi:hypothetical protein
LFVHPGGTRRTNVVSGTNDWRAAPAPNAAEPRPAPARRPPSAAVASRVAEEGCVPDAFHHPPTTTGYLSEENGGAGHGIDVRRRHHGHHHDVSIMHGTTRGTHPQHD